jgi:hypothetical protein
VLVKKWARDRCGGRLVYFVVVVDGRRWSTHVMTADALKLVKRWARDQCEDLCLDMQFNASYGRK